MSEPIEKILASWDLYDSTSRLHVCESTSFKLRLFGLGVKNPSLIRLDSVPSTNMEPKMVNGFPMFIYKRDLVAVVLGQTSILHFQSLTWKWKTPVCRGNLSCKGPLSTCMIVSGSVYLES